MVCVQESRARCTRGSPEVWKLYDELIAAVPEDAVVTECLAGLSWFLVRSLGTGVAMRPREIDEPMRNAGKIAGMKAAGAGRLDQIMELV